MYMNFFPKKKEKVNDLNLQRKYPKSTIGAQIVQCVIVTEMRTK